MLALKKEEIPLKDILFSNRISDRVSITKINGKWVVVDKKKNKKRNYGIWMLVWFLLIVLFIFFAPLFSLFIFIFKKNKLYGLFVLILWVSLPVLWVIKILEFLKRRDKILQIDNVRDYDWIGLLNSIEKHGYSPDEFNGGYITVSKVKNGYSLIDGNHRIKILREIYDENHKIMVEIHHFNENMSDLPLLLRGGIL